MIPPPHRPSGPATLRALLWSLLLLLPCAPPLHAADLETQLATDRAAGILTDHDALMHRLYGLYDPARLPARYQTLEITPNYCVTILHAEAYASLSQMTAIEKECTQ